ncbi:MAG: nucleotidyltransferase domain-containing protein [Candidatus Geothermincolia bacterium]
MRITRPLDDVLGNKNHIRVLRHLILFPSPVITGRGIAREIGMSHVSCIRSLNELEAIGALVRRSIGTSSTYEIPADSILLSKMLKPLFVRESGLLDGLVGCLLEGIEQAVLSVYLYGSVARSEETATSDVDLLVVLKRGANKREVEKKLASNKSEAFRQYLVGIHVITYSYNEYQTRKQKGLPLIKEVLSEGRLLVGREV